MVAFLPSDILLFSLLSNTSCVWFQFFSLWLYDKNTLTGFAKHYRTREQIPDELFDELLLERARRSSLRLLEQIYDGQLEIELYNSAAGNASILQIQNELNERYTPENATKMKKGDLSKFVDILAIDVGEPEFRHLYLISEIMSCDAFEAFEDVGLGNEEAVKKLGKKFRKIILASGGGCNALDAFRRFRGRDFTPEAFLQHNGLL